MRSIRTIESDVINFQHYLTSVAIFQSFTDLFRELNDYEIENHSKMNSVNVETWHGIIIHPHSMCKIVERVKAKTGRTLWTNWKISFRVSGFRTRTHLLHGHFIFLNWFELQNFFAFLCTIQRDVINFQHFLTSFAIFQSFTDMFRELNDREIENHYKMNSENVETWHGIIISPTWHVQNSRVGYGKK